MVAIRLGQRGQLTLPKTLQRHLGVKPGDLVELAPAGEGRVAMTPGRKVELEAVMALLLGDLEGDARSEAGKHAPALLPASRRRSG
jgi:bifunctional DNA-binding transcriptional regulator/antitoxin component of YhaV-PrlF toxin-antitoxin module